MPIVTEKEMAKSFRLEKYGQLGVQLSRQFMSWLRISDINTIYDIYKHLEGLDFVNAVLDHLNIVVVLSESDIKRIPKKGPFIAIANHPLGAIDGLIMLKILLTYHPDVKLMANFLLKKIEPLSKYFCAVNPFETRKLLFNSSTGIRQALNHIADGCPLAIFPAGEVSVRTHKLAGPVTDKSWDMSAIKIIKKANLPVLPVYFHGHNSNMFYLMSDINAHLRTVSLPSEFIRTKNKKIYVRIGNPISTEQQSNTQNIQQYAHLLRTRTYLLMNSFIESKSKPIQKYFPKRKIFEVLQYQTISELPKIFNTLATTDALLFTNGDYQVFFTNIKKHPSIKVELGRLRELTFRAVGEGTNKALDLDKYDEYYHHLILWDKKSLEIAGAYRMALGSDVYKNYGLKGFYLSYLFHLKGSMHDILSQSIEMGRAFITRHYQQRPMPLFYLWKGINKIMQMYPQYRYLIGAASISNSYCLYSKSLMVEYLKIHHMDTKLSDDVYPMYSFKSILKLNEKEMVAIGDIKEIERLIEEIEPHGLKLPVLIKKYLFHNAKILGFNVDPAFNNAVDALMYIKIEDIDKVKFS